MDLRSAITTAAGFCWKGKQKSAMKSIRFLPEDGQHRPALFASSGAEGVHIQLDVPVPNVMFDGEKCANAVKGTKGDLAFEQVNAQTWKIAGVHLATGAVEEFPSLPVIPQSWSPCPDWWVIKQIMHAVSKDKNRQDLMCLHFTDKAVEATDRHQVARAFIAGKWQGLVPLAAVKKLPKGDVEYHFTDTVASFRVGDETRMVMLVKHGRFEPCADVLPAQYGGPSYAVSTLDLIEAAKRAKGLKAKRIDVKFSKPGDASLVRLTAGGWSVVLDAYPVVEHPELPVTIGVSTTQLYDALRAAETPRVRVGFTTGSDPLRIDAGPVAMGLWGFTE